MTTGSLLPDHKQMLLRYYNSLESRIGYKLFLGNTRHFGYYTTSTSFPFPISTSLRAMEGKLLKALQCPKGSRVLDAGCGNGQVAIYMATMGGYQVDCIEIVPRHAQAAKRNIEKAGLESQISIQVGDYHDLRAFKDNCLDGIYTMETLVHSTNPAYVLREFLRLLKPGGRIALHEYDHIDLPKAPKDLAYSMEKVNRYAAMPANASFNTNVLRTLLEETGFEDVHLIDMSENIVPMLRLFYIFAILPYYIFKFLGIEDRFVNTIAGAQAYKGRPGWRYTQIVGKKAEAISAP